MSIKPCTSLLLRPPGSSGSGLLIVPNIKIIAGDVTFGFCGPRCRNTLSDCIWCAPALTVFKSKLCVSYWIWLVHSCWADVLGPLHAVYRLKEQKRNYYLSKYVPWLNAAEHPDREGRQSNKTPSSKEQLERIMCEKWQKISTQICVRLVSSVPIWGLKLSSNLKVDVQNMKEYIVEIKCVSVATRS